MFMNKPSLLAQIRFDACPLVPGNITREALPDGRVRLSITIAYRWRFSLLRKLLALPEIKTIELDKLGQELLDLCDGRRSLEAVIDAHCARWKLSFFEGRNLIFGFLSNLMKRGFISFAAAKDHSQSAT